VPKERPKKNRKCVGETRTSAKAGKVDLPEKRLTEFEQAVQSLTEHAQRK